MADLAWRKGICCGLVAIKLKRRRITRQPTTYMPDFRSAGEKAFCHMVSCAGSAASLGDGGGMCRRPQAAGEEAKDERDHVV
jgi:hypothetical protein